MIDSDIIHSMVAEVSVQLPLLKRLCQRHNVFRLWLFGSATGRGRANFDAVSDIDFLVEFDRVAHPLRGFSDPFWGLLIDLEDLFGRRIDLVELRPFKDDRFRESIEATRELIYEQDRIRTAV